MHRGKKTLEEYGRQGEGCQSFSSEPFNPDFKKTKDTNNKDLQLFTSGTSLEMMQEKKLWPTAVVTFSMWKGILYVWSAAKA